MQARGEALTTKRLNERTEVKIIVWKAESWIIVESFY